MVTTLMSRDDGRCLPEWWEGEDELFPMTIELHPREHIISLKIANLDIYLSYEAGVGSLLPRG